jgi:outer membrane protein OmpA-like peptidoglycan-associated protein
MHATLRQFVSAAALALWVAAPGLAGAAGSVDVTGFQTSPFAGDLPNTATTAVGVLMRPQIGLGFHFVLNPFGITGTDQYGQTATEETITSRMITELVASFSPIAFLDIGLALPMVLNQSGKAAADGFSGLGDMGGFAMGELRLVVRGVFLREGLVRVGLQADATLPTGDADKLAGNGLGGGPTILLDVHAGIFMAALNVGFYFREDGVIQAPRVATPYLEVSHEMRLALSGAVEIIKGLQVEGGAYSKTQLTSPFEGNTTQFEAVLGLRYHPIPEFSVALGGGGGTPLVQGLGTSQMRAFADFRYIMQPSLDRDGDGVPDGDDQCPQLPEDKDGFEDGDGCPDPDNDGDGILDLDDRCPLDAEDKDGFEDEDGCPDRDNDGDGIDDADDKCPSEREDIDGFEDGDGCPDPDNDGDGIPDAQDKCPDTKETPNGFEDEDGCPDFQGVSFEGEAISVTPAIEFKRGKDDINASYFDVLRNLAKLIEAHPEWKKIEIQVATDEKGKPDKLLELTTKRAMAIQQFLVTEGVNFRILKVRAKGKADPAGVRFVIKP